MVEDQVGDLFGQRTVVGDQPDRRIVAVLGLADEVVPDDELLDRALALAAGYAAGPRLAIRAAKRAIDEGSELSTTAGVDLELDLFMGVFETDDARHGVESFFQHGPGKATFSGS